MAHHQNEWNQLCKCTNCMYKKNVSGQIITVPNPSKEDDEDEEI